jgi:PAS domain S-box-containing protein
VTQSGYLFLGLTAIVAVLAAVLAYAVITFIAAARDLTRRRRSDGSEATLVASAMEDALRSLREQERAMKARAEASERLSEEIVASLTSGLLVVDDSGVVRTLNPAGRRLLGLSGGDWKRPYREVLAGALELADVIEESVANARPVVRRTVKTQGAGGVTHVGVTVSPIRNEEGLAHGAICLFTDISEIIDLEDQLRLKDSLARLGELTAGIAHEFRNGLATIHGYSRLMDPERLPEDFRPYLAGIRSETEALGQVVTNFLNFAKPTQLTLTPVDLAALVVRATEDIRSDVQAREGELDVKGTFGRVDGDEVLLRQAVSNLCRNALEACVDAGVTPRIVVEGTVDREARTVRVTVTDNGPGLKPEVAASMFRPFFTTKARGTGLGLALVQKIIVTHNGRVSALPSEEGGARVVFTLPLAGA